MKVFIVGEYSKAKLDRLVMDEVARQATELVDQSFALITENEIRKWIVSFELPNLIKLLLSEREQLIVENERLKEEFTIK